jgi:PA14 domain/Pectate lyase superfamily protein
MVWLLDVRVAPMASVLALTLLAACGDVASGGDAVRTFDDDLTAAQLEQAVKRRSAVNAPQTSGLRARYYSDISLQNLVLDRIDDNINFNWQLGVPASGVQDEGFSVRWTGWVTAAQSEEYTFHTVSDDGVRLWVNEQLLIDNWTLHPATTDTGRIRLEAGRPVSIRMEYFENAGNAVAKLRWSSASQPKSIVPSSALSPQAPEAGVAEINVEYPVGTPGVYNVRDYGAKGDGVTDDTAAIVAASKAIDDVPFSRPNADFSVIYLPNGTYLVSDTIQWRNFRILQGQSRSGVVIRLKDGAPGYGDTANPKPVVRCLFNNNESIGNYIRHLTVDIGQGNAGAVGIRYNAHNQGMLEHVTIRSGDGSGAIGLDLSETEFGPAMVKHVSVQGFDVGIVTPGQPSHATLAHIRLLGQRVAGIRNFLPISIQDLNSANSVPAIVNGDGNLLAQLTVIGARLEGGDASNVAIENNGTAYLRDVATSGYGAALSNKGMRIDGATTSEFFEGERISLFDSRPGHIGLPLEAAPEVFVEPAANWVAPPNVAGDDTASIQSAIDSGARTIFLPWGANYEISDTIVVRGTVRRILGMHRGGISGPIDTFRSKPMLRVQGNGQYPVSIEALNTSTYPSRDHISVEMDSTQPLYLKSMFVYPSALITNSAAATGKLFIDDTSLLPRITAPLTMQLRQFNPENNPYDPLQSKPVTYLENRGARFVALGWKSEAPAVHAKTTEGGQTEILGGFFRDFFDIAGVPYFETVDADLSATYYQYASGCGDTRTLHARETRSAETREAALTPNCSRPIAIYGARR